MAFGQGGNGVDLMTQAAMLQMGHIAQAHAAEAVRLQTMAACLQANATVTAGNLPSHMQAAVQGAVLGGFDGQGAMAPCFTSRPCTAPGVGATMAVPGQNAQRMMLDVASAEATYSQADQTNFIQNSLLAGANDRDLLQNCLAGMPPTLTYDQLEAIVPCGAEPCNFQSGISTGMAVPVASSQGLGAMDVSQASRRLGGEPVSIHPCTLRSLSSNSLASMAEETPESRSGPAQQSGCTISGSTAEPRGPPALGGWKVKNTFLDYDATTSPARGMRPISSAAARLDAWAEDGSRNDEFQVDSTPSTASAQMSMLDLVPEHAVIAGSPTEKRSQDTPLCLPQQAPGSSASWSVTQQAVPGAGQNFGKGGDHCHDLEEGSADLVEASTSPTLGQTQSWEHGDDGTHGFNHREPALLVETLGANGITVKNTFLDFASEQPAKGMRTVRTAAGRLNLLGEE